MSEKTFWWMFALCGAAGLGTTAALVYVVAHLIAFDPPSAVQGLIGSSGWLYSSDWRCGVKILSAGRKAAPFSVFIYGPQGAGKSTAAADFPDPLFLSGSEGSSELDVKRVAFDGERTGAQSWDEVLSSVVALKATNGFKTLVIDELQAIELLCAAAVCRREKVDSLGKVGGGFGKGEVALLAEMRLLLKAAEDIHSAGKHVVFCCHSKQGKVPRPETGDTFIRYEPALTSVNNADIGGMFVGWANAVLFIRPDIAVAKVGDGFNKKTIGVSSGERHMHTEGEAAWVAKCRYRGVDPVIVLPATHPMAPFFGQVAEGQSVEKMQAKVKCLAEQVGGDAAVNAAAFFKSSAANDLTALHEAARNLKAMAA